MKYAIPTLLMLTMLSFSAAAEDVQFGAKSTTTTPAPEQMVAKEKLLGSTGKVVKSYNPYRNTPESGYIQAQVDEEFTIRLPMIQGDTHQWFLDKPVDPEYLQKLDNEKIQTQGRNLAEFTEWRFKALKPGRVELVAAYKKSEGSARDTMRKMYVINIE